MAFWPVMASSTSRVSTLAAGQAFSTLRRIFASSAIRLCLVCRRPAVSQMTMSTPLAAADCTASNTTAAGSAPSPWRTTGTPTRSAQMVSCSAAAARKVSPAASSTLLPWLL